MIKANKYDIQIEGDRPWVENEFIGIVVTLKKCLCEQTATTKEEADAKIKELTKRGLEADEMFETDAEKKARELFEYIKRTFPHVMKEEPDEKIQ